MGETEISWTHRPGTVGRSWNPGQGCSRISTGCENCYAERLAARFAENGWSKGLINLKTGKWNGKVRLAAHKLAEPLGWKKPSTVFVNSMTDMFHDGYSNEEIAAVFGVMAATPQHTYQMLTKRAERMREWFAWVGDMGSTRTLRRCGNAADDAGVPLYDPLGNDAQGRTPWNDCRCVWPLSNVWLGVSVENQDAADERIPELLNTPAAVRFLSCEPLIGAVDLEKVHDDELGATWNALATGSLHWVIAGCESGPRSRPCDIHWLRSLRDQCANARVPFFLKQATATSFKVMGSDNEIHDVWEIGAAAGSKSKGRGVIELPYLDGMQHASFPEVSCST